MKVTDEMVEAIARVLEDNGLLIDEHEPEQIIAAVAPLILEEAAKQLAFLFHENETRKPYGPGSADFINGIRFAHSQGMAAIRKLAREG